METVVHNTRAMANPYKTQVGEFGIPITDEQYKELRSYAVAHGIRITGFRNYVGDIETIKIIIDDISSLSLIMDMLNMKSKSEIFYRLGKELSIYSAAYNDGREIISESFSGYYSKVGNSIADEFVNRCLAARKEGEQDEGL